MKHLKSNSYIVKLSFMSHVMFMFILRLYVDPFKGAIENDTLLVQAHHHQN